MVGPSCTHQVPGLHMIAIWDLRLVRVMDTLVHVEHLCRGRCQDLPVPVWGAVIGRAVEGWSIVFYFVDMCLVHEMSSTS